MNYSDSIILGVVSGILTSAFLFLLVQIFQRIVLPWYQSLIYNGIIIEGNWVCKGSSGTQDIILDLKQKAHQIKGTAEYITIDSTVAFEQIRKFEISGILKDRFLIFTTMHNDRKRIGVSAHLLEVVGDGRVMKGGRVYYNVNGDNISFSEISYQREELITALKSLKVSAPEVNSQK